MLSLRRSSCCVFYWPSLKHILDATPSKHQVSQHSQHNDVTIIIIVCVRAPTSLSFLRWSLCSLLSHLSVRIQRVLETLSERTFADVALAFFIIIFFFFFVKKRKRKHALWLCMWSVHLHHLSAEAPDLEKDWQQPAPPPQWIIPFFNYRYSYATCHSACSSQPRTTWNQKNQLNSILPPEGHDKKIYRFLYMCVCIYTCINIWWWSWWWQIFFLYIYIEMDFFFISFPPPSAEGVQLCRCIHNYRNVDSVQKNGE